MSLTLHPPVPPMEAVSVAEVPQGNEWQYEPKWDGFRCVAFRDGGEIYLQSKSEQPLARYFPELCGALRQLPATQFVLDGEIAVPDGEAFSFDALLQRIHPAASRIEKLALETPAIIIVFDLLADANGKSMLSLPLSERRNQLELFAEKNFSGSKSVFLSPTTTQLADAQNWLAKTGSTLDGIIAKRRDLGYGSGERGAMQKIKNYRSADCVVGGFRYGAGKKVVGSLLLGLYDRNGLLNHVGFTSGLASADRAAITARLETHIQPPGFTGRAPGGPSRWNRGKSNEWQPLEPHFVVEVGYDHVTGERFRHGTRLLRWRPDKAPRQCTMVQLEQVSCNLLTLWH